MASGKPDETKSHPPPALPVPASVSEAAARARAALAISGQPEGLRKTRERTSKRRAAHRRMASGSEAPGGTGA